MVAENPGWDALDMEALESARKIVQDKFPQMVEYYLEDTQTCIKQAREALEKKDAQQVMISAHTVKSSSHQLGAMEMSRIAKDMEELTRDVIGGKRQGFDDVTPLMDALEAAFEVVKPQFKALVKDS